MPEANIPRALSMAASKLGWGTISIDPPSIDAGAASNVEVGAGALAMKTTDIVTAFPMDSAFEALLIPLAADCSADGTLRVRIANRHTAAVDGAARTWMWIRLR